MTASNFARFAGTLFGLVALAHVARLVLDVPVTIGNAPIPMAASWLGAAVGAALCAWGWRVAR